jgi:hypothetical protein
MRKVLIAVDGVAPRAKMNQQRTRRFLSAYVSDITEKVGERWIRIGWSVVGGWLSLTPQPPTPSFDASHQPRTSSPPKNR